MPDTTLPVTGEVLKDDPNFPIHGEVINTNDLVTPRGEQIKADLNYVPAADF